MIKNKKAQYFGVKSILYIAILVAVIWFAIQWNLDPMFKLFAIILGLAVIVFFGKK